MMRRAAHLPAVVLMAVVAVPSIAAAGDGASIAILAGLSSTGGAGGMEELATAARYQLADLGLTVRVVRVDDLPGDAEGQERLARETAGRTGAIAVVWLTPRGEGSRFALLMISGGADWLVTRDVAISDSTALAETLAAIVRASITAFRSGAGAKEEPPQRAPARVEDEAPGAPAIGEEKAPVEPKTAPAGRTVLARIGVGYRVGATSEDAGPSHGLGLLAGVRSGRLLGAHVGYTFWGPLVVRRFGIALTVERHPVALGFDFLRAWGRFGLEVVLDIELDYVRREIRAFDEAMIAGDRGGYLQAALAPEARAALRIAGPVSLYLGGGAEIFFNRPSYDVTLESGVETLYRPWPVQPFGCAGLELEI